MKAAAKMSDEELRSHLADGPGVGHNMVVLPSDTRVILINLHKEDHRRNDGFFHDHGDT